MDYSVAAYEHQRGPTKVNKEEVLRCDWQTITLLIQWVDLADQDRLEIVHSHLEAMDHGELKSGGWFARHESRT